MPFQGDTFQGDSFEGNIPTEFTATSYLAYQESFTATGDLYTLNPLVAVATGDIGVVEEITAVATLSTNPRGFLASGDLEQVPLKIFDAVATLFDNRVRREIIGFSYLSELYHTKVFDANGSLQNPNSIVAPQDWGEELDPEEIINGRLFDQELPEVDSALYKDELSLPNVLSTSNNYNVLGEEGNGIISLEINSNVSGISFSAEVDQFHKWGSLSVGEFLEWTVSGKAIKLQIKTKSYSKESCTYSILAEQRLEILEKRFTGILDYDPARVILEQNGYLCVEDLARGRYHNSILRTKVGDAIKKIFEEFDTKLEIDEGIPGLSDYIPYDMDYIDPDAKPRPEMITVNEVMNQLIGWAGYRVFSMPDGTYRIWGGFPDICGEVPPFATGWSQAYYEQPKEIQVNGGAWPDEIQEDDDPDNCNPKKPAEEEVDNGTFTIWEDASGPNGDEVKIRTIVKKACGRVISEIRETWGKVTRNTWDGSTVGQESTETLFNKEEKIFVYDPFCYEKPTDEIRILKAYWWPFGVSAYFPDGIEIEYEHTKYDWHSRGWLKNKYSFKRTTLGYSYIGDAIYYNYVVGSSSERWIPLRRKVLPINLSEAQSIADNSSYDYSFTNWYHSTTSSNTKQLTTSDMSKSPYDPTSIDSSAWTKPTTMSEITDSQPPSIQCGICADGVVCEWGTTKNHTDGLATFSRVETIGGSGPRISISVPGINLYSPRPTLWPTEDEINGVCGQPKPNRDNEIPEVNEKDLTDYTNYALYGNTPTTTWSANIVCTAEEAFVFAGEVMENYGLIVSSRLSVNYEKERGLIYNLSLEGEIYCE